MYFKKSRYKNLLEENFGSLLISTIIASRCKSDHGEFISGRCENRKIGFPIKCTHIKALRSLISAGTRSNILRNSVYDFVLNARAISFQFSSSILRLASISISLRPLPPNMPRQIETRTIERTDRDITISASHLKSPS